MGRFYHPHGSHPPTASTAQLPHATRAAAGTHPWRPVSTTGQRSLGWTIFIEEVGCIINQYLEHPGATKERRSWLGYVGIMTTCTWMSVGLNLVSWLHLKGVISLLWARSQIAAPGHSSYTRYRLGRVETRIFFCTSVCVTWNSHTGQVKFIFGMQNVGLCAAFQWCRSFKIAALQCIYIYNKYIYVYVCVYDPLANTHI